MDIEQIVIGVDFSGIMTRAAPWVCRHFAPGAAVTLVHAAERAAVPAFLRDLMPPRAVDAELRDAEQRLREWAADAGLTEPEIVVSEERADTLLLDVTRETAAELMVIGPHAGHERPWQRLGTTAERLLRAAETSLLVVRGPMTEAPKRIVVAVDDAEITARVLATSGALADRFDARLHAVHVLSNAAYSHVLSAEAAEAHSEAEKRRKVEQDMAEEALRWLTELWRNTTHHEHLEIEVPHGVAGDEILHAAERINADLIVIGRYGAGRLIPALLGSVVGSVVHGANCPVLVVADEVKRD